MRIGLTWISQETDTFNPDPTVIGSFAAFGIDRGSAIVEKLGSVGSIGGYLEAASVRPDVETVPLFKARAVAGGRLSADTLAFLSDELASALRSAGRLDGLALQLHGACAADGVDDVEGHLLAVARKIVGDIPIVMSLDHHANITRAMVEGSEAIVGHRTQPHDPYDTGRIGAEVLFAIVDGRIDPVTAWRKIPLISHQEQYLTSQGPMKVWFDRARAIESEHSGVVQVSPFPMQPWLDVEEGGWSIVVVTDGDRHLAESLADELAELAWSMRWDFQVKASLSPADAVRAADEAGGLTVISDTGDSVLGGAGGDSTVLLAEMLRARITGRALVPIVDPVAAAELMDRSVGESVTVDVGGRVAGFHQTISLTGTLVRCGVETVEIGDGYASPVVELGETAVLDTDIGTVVITARPGVGGVHPDKYRALGVDPSDHSMVVVKTASNFQYFAPISTGVVRADTPGPTQSDMAGLTWNRIPRPVYPLDDIEHWR